MKETEDKLEMEIKKISISWSDWDTWALTQEEQERLLQALAWSLRLPIQAEMKVVRVNLHGRHPREEDQVYCAAVYDGLTMFLHLVPGGQM
jgi:hypothetical protein